MAAGATYVSIASQTLSSAASSITFSSISGAYTDLVLVCNGSMAASSNINLQVNGNTAANYSYTELDGNGTSAASSRVSGGTYIQVTDGNGYWTSTANAGTLIINFMNYSNTTTNKTILTRGNNAAIGVNANVGLWRQTSAITSILLYGSSQNFASGSTFSLYGIAAA